MKKIIVVQNSGGCRILVNPEKGLYEGKKHLVNPDVSHMNGIPPEHWEIVNGVVFPNSQSDHYSRRESMLLPEFVDAEIAKKALMGCLSALDKTLKILVMSPGTLWKRAKLRCVWCAMRVAGILLRWA